MSDGTEPQQRALPLALAADDAAALDAIFNTGFAESSGAEPRQRRVREVLALLDASGPAADPVLVDVTMARVMRNGLRLVDADPELSPSDREALDAWVHAGYDAARVPSSLRARAQRLQDIAGLVTGPTASASGGAEGGAGADDLLERTLAAVEAARTESGAYSFRGSWRSNFRLGDLVSIAALLLIAVSVVWPVMAGVRSQATKIACAGNLHDVAAAMAAYAGSNRDQMPMATASLGGGRWWDVGAPNGSSNSSNLFTLAKTGFASLASLACPGNPDACRTGLTADARDWRNLKEVSYSYQIMFGPARRTLHGAERAPVLADRSPVVLRAVRGEVIDPWENSPNHADRGQELLFTDGSSQWLRTPMRKNGDNIWLPRVVEDALRQAALSQGLRLHGTETPQGADDVFLAP